MISINYLKKTCTLFKSLEDSFLEEQLKIGFITEQTFAATDFLPISETNGLFCIMEGSLDILEISKSGNLMLVEHFEKGMCIGANTLFLDENGSNVIGRTHSSLKAVVIHKEGILDLLSSNKQFLKAFLALVSKRSTMLTRKIGSLSFKSLEKKVMVFLYDLSENQKCSDVTLYLSKKRLSEFFGVARTSLSRRLSDMERRGLLEVRGKRIRLTPTFFETYKKAFVSE
jgi:CRP-like cAMP-binding protein